VQEGKQDLHKGIRWIAQFMDIQRHCVVKIYYILFFSYKNRNIIIQTYYKYTQNKFYLKIHNCILIFTKKYKLIQTYVYNDIL